MITVCHIHFHMIAILITNSNNSKTVDGYINYNMLNKK